MFGEEEKIIIEVNPSALIVDQYYQVPIELAIKSEEWKGNVNKGITVFKKDSRATDASISCQ